MDEINYARLVAMVSRFSLETSRIFISDNGDRPDFIDSVVSVERLSHSKLTLINPDLAKSYYREAVKAGQVKLFHLAAGVTVKVAAENRWSEPTSKEITFMAFGLTPEQAIAQIQAYLKTVPDIIEATPSNPHHSVRKLP